VSADDLDELRQALVDDIEAVAAALLGKPNRAASTRRTLRWGRRGSLAVELAGRKRGLWHDHEANQGGGLFELIRRALDCDFVGAVAWARNWTGLPATERPRPPPPPPGNEAPDDDEKDRIARARALWAASRPLPGTLAERYLVERRAIPRPPTGWPAAVRYHAPARALILAATDDAGAVQAVQVVRLDAEGRKADDGKPAKLSYGRLAGAALRLEAMPGADTVLQLAEGPETALTVWAATGHETWCALGSMGKLKQPPFGTLLVAADDDPPAAPAAKALAKAVARWRAEGRRVAVATPWSVRRHDRSDFNDVAQALGLEAVAERLRQAVAPEPPAPVVRLPVEEARRRLDDAVAEFVRAARRHDAMRAKTEAQGLEPPAPPVHVAKASTGLGKSRIARRHVAELLRALRAAGDGRTVAIAVPRHALAAEQAALFAELAEVKAGGLTVATWRGREADDPARPGEKMCKNLDAVREAQAAGLDVQAAACRRKIGATVFACPFFEGCAYQAQRQRRADLWLVPHELLFTSKPRAIGALAALIVDESCWAAGLEGVTGRGTAISVESLAARADLPRGHAGLGDDQARLDDCRRRLHQALADHPDGPLHRETLLAAGIAAETGRDGRALSWRRLVGDVLRPGMTATDRREALAKAAGNRQAMREARLFGAVEALLADDGPPASGWAELSREATDAGEVRVVRLRGRKPVRDGWLVPTLHLDALADVEMLRPYWPGAELVADLEAEAPHQRIFQVADRTFGKSALAPDDYCDEGEARRRARNSRDTKAAALAIARHYGGRPVLVVAQKIVREAWQASGALPAYVELAHHNAITGADGWRDVAALVVVGRTLPRPADAERLAEALTGRAVERLGGPYPRADAVRLLRNGGAVAAEAVRHPDAMVEAVRWQIAEGELLQIIGRARGVNRQAGKPVDVFVLTDLPLPLPVELLPWAAVAPSPAELQLAAGGMAFVEPAHAAAAYPELWRSHDAAKKAFSRQSEVRDIPHIDIPYWGMSLTSCRYQLRGAGQRPAEAEFDPTVVLDPRGFIEAHLGPLAAFEVPGEAPPPEARPAAPTEAARRPEPAPVEPAEPAVPPWPPPEPAIDLPLNGFVGREPPCLAAVPRRMGIAEHLLAGALLAKPRPPFLDGLAGLLRKKALAGRYELAEVLMMPPPWSPPGGGLFGLGPPPWPPTPP